jgi:uncharacterized membrane protein
VVNAPIDIVWEVLHDVDAIAEWQPDMRSARCLKRDAAGRPVLVHMVLDTVIKQAEATLRVIYDEPGVMRWEKHRGDVPNFVGSWRLAAIPVDRTLIEYQLTIDFGRFGKLVRGPLAGAVNGAVASSMPGKLKAYVEGLDLSLPDRRNVERGLTPPSDQHALIPK